jgi:nitroimidazol reductase NimA-like FMN-containing flavoprotein (pyridoxamine 5'-phosphate oxidase superfamily)
MPCGVISKSDDKLGVRDESGSSWCGQPAAVIAAQGLAEESYYQHRAASGDVRAIASRFHEVRFVALAASMRILSSDKGNGRMFCT